VSIAGREGQQSGPSRDLHVKSRKTALAATLYRTKIKRAVPDD
jgi:hypothetical protein